MILATIGPKSDLEKTWQDMVTAGAAAFRIPFAKETPDIQFGKCKRIKESSWEGRGPLVLADLPGGKPRTTNDLPVKINAGENLALVPAHAADQIANGLVGVWPMPAHWGTNDVIVFGDEDIVATITSAKQDRYDCLVTRGGTLNQKRGVANRSQRMSYETITDFDRTICNDHRSAYLDGYIISFVDSPDDVAAARNELRSFSSDKPLIISKIETAAGLDNIQEIIPASDGILIGLGDLLIQVGLRRFFNVLDGGLSRLRASPHAEIPIMIGTELLEISTARQAPYRAEIGFIGYVLSRGCTGLLLSGETTVGDNPVAAVELAAKLVAELGDR